jgi:hypothetical protein
VLFLLKRGCLYTYCLSSSGRKLVLSEYETGTVCGLLALVGDGCYGLFAEAVEPTLLCLLPTAMLWRLAQQVDVEMLRDIAENDEGVPERVRMAAGTVSTRSK